MSDYTVYAEGLVFMSVCSALPADDLVERIRTERPSGTEHGWQLSEEPFRGGQPNPCPCDQHPDTHKHYLFVC